MEQVYHVEQVIDGQLANWPNSPDYEEPVRSGHTLIGWDYDWDVDPITEDTDIRAIWEEVQLHIECNKQSIGYEGDEDLGDLTVITYWAETVDSHVMLPDGVEMQVVENERGELPIVYEVSSVTVEDGKNVETIIISPNEEPDERLLRFKAVTTKYGGMESGIIEMTQEGKVFILAVNGDSHLLYDTSYHSDVRTPSITSTINGEYYGDVQMQLDFGGWQGEDWVHIIEMIQTSPTELAFRLEILPFPSGGSYDPTVGRNATATITQNGGLQTTLQIQQIMNSDTISVHFRLFNDRGDTTDPTTFKITLETTTSGLPAIQVNSTHALDQFEEEVIVKTLSDEYENTVLTGNHPSVGKANDIVHSQYFDIDNLTIHNYESESDLISIIYRPPE